MNFQHIRPVVLAGGSGTRLWPVSRSLFPKQFTALVGEPSLFEQTVQRLAGFGMPDPIGVGNEAHRFISPSNCAGAASKGLILLEPEGRNTAGAIALSAEAAAVRDGDAILFVMPSDHWIGNADKLGRGVKIAVEVSRAGQHRGRRHSPRIAAFRPRLYSDRRGSSGHRRCARHPLVSRKVGRGYG